MKQKVLALFMALALLAGLQIPALGAQDFGLVYDDTDLLDTEYIRSLAYDTFQTMTNDYEAQFRLDVMTGLEDGEALSVAQSFYEKYEYGDGDDKAGVLLLLSLDPDDTGLTFREYAVLPMGYAAQVVTGQTMIELERLLNTYFNDEMWSADLETDQTVFETAMEEYADYLDTLFMACDPDALQAPAETPAEEEAPENQPVIAPAPQETFTFVWDEADLLTDAEETEFTAQAEILAQEYGCGVYMVTVNDYLDYSSESAYEAAKTFYQTNGLGVGSEENGIMLMLSVADRDYALIAYGSVANTAFTDYGKTLMEEEFLDDFAEDDWYWGFSDYMLDCQTYLAMAASGTPMDVGVEDEDYEPMTLGEEIGASLVIGLGIGILVALIFCLVSKAKMKSAREKTAAEEYVIDNGMELYANEDRYLHTSVVRKPRPKKESGGTTIDLGGFSGKSGKF